MANFGTVASDTILNRQVILTVESVHMGVSAPTAVSLGTSPEVGALLFDATAELASVSFQLPPDMDKTVNPSMVFLISLIDTETNDDTLDLTADYTVPIQNSTGNGIAKTSTQITAQTTVTTANGLAIGDAYEITFAVDAGDATNPLASGVHIAFEFHLTNITEVAGMHLLGVCFMYRALY